MLSINDSSLFTCLEASFPGIQKTIGLLDTLGYPWAKISKPFIATNNNRVVAHAGVIEVEIIVDGRVTKYASIHAVCTLPDHRHQGLGRKVIQEAIAFAQPKYENVILFTCIPAFYERLGFAAVKEHSFHFTRGSNTPRSGTLVPLRADNPSDVSSLKQHIAKRIPLSSVFCTPTSTAIHIYNMLGTYPKLKDLYYIPEIDSIVACAREGGSLKIYDVFSSQHVPIDFLLGCFEEPITDVFFYFSPDGFNVDARPIPYADPEDVFMTLSPLKLPQRPFMMPLLSRS